MVYQPAPAPAGYQPVLVPTEDAFKALKPPGFATAEEAAIYQTPLEQPIPHIARTNNPDQFDARKSQSGRDVELDVIQTPPPVTNVYVQVGVDPHSLALSAELPPGLDQGTLISRTPGKLFTPAAGGNAPPTGNPPQTPAAAPPAPAPPAPPAPAPAPPAAPDPPPPAPPDPDPPTA
jgi:hypothetical protein